MRTQKVTIKLMKDLMTHFQLEVYSHEIPLYEAAHPDGEITVLSNGEIVDIDFTEEYQRLLHKFGKSSENDTMLVDEVYGHGGRALATSSFEINPDVVARSEEVVVPVPAKTEEKYDLAKARELCEQLGIKITKTMNGDTLNRMLNAKREEFTAVVTERGIDANELDLLELKGLVDDINEEAA